MKKSKAILAGSVLFTFLFPCSIHAQTNVLNFTDRAIPQGVMTQISQGKKADIPGSKSSGKNWGKSITVVELRGKTNHFGIDITTGQYIDYWATVPGVKVWISEYPFTKGLDIRTDETGWWTMYVIKYAGEDLEFSFVYEKDGWVTTKTNVITVTDDDDTDLAIQYIDPLYYQFAVKPFVEAVFLGGAPIENAMVVTVGKSWASMHDGRLPHGDPDAMAMASPALGIGPIYFNEAVQPDPGQTGTSLDGGVTWLNMPVNNTYYVTASKDGVNYPTVRFNIDLADRVEDGVELYIASPPDSVEGNNDSGPGQP
jgi:hypothetical protein